MQISRVFSFAGLLLPCLANPIDQPSSLADNVPEEAINTTQPIVDVRSGAAPYDDKAPQFCKDIQARVDDKSQWRTEGLDQAMCHSVLRTDRARKDWEFIIPNSKIFDQIPDDHQKRDPEVHHIKDCGHRLRSEVKGPGWRLMDCTLDNNGTATIKMRSYITSSSESVDKAIQRATCGHLSRFPKCFQTKKYILNY